MKTSTFIAGIAALFLATGAAHAVEWPWVEPNLSPAKLSPPLTGPKTVTRLYYEPGGEVVEHWRRWSALAASGDNVEIRGSCMSACTLIMALIPRDRLCFGTHSSLQFHITRDPKSGKTTPNTSQWMLEQYPEDIRKWLIARGGVDKMTVMDMWVLKDWQLWSMGYRKCEPEAPG